MNRITAMTHSAVKIGFLCCLMMVLGTTIKAQNKGGYEKITIEETDPFGTKAVKDKKKGKGYKSSKATLGKKIEILAKVNPLLFFTGEFMGFGEIVYRERVGIELGLGITDKNNLAQYNLLTGNIVRSDLMAYYSLGLNSDQSSSSSSSNKNTNNAKPEISYGNGSAIRIEGRIYLGENNYNDATSFLLFSYRARDYSFSYAKGTYNPNNNGIDTAANLSQLDMDLKISEFVFGYGVSYPIDEHFGVEVYTTLGTRKIKLNTPTLSDGKGVYSFENKVENQLIIGFGLKVGYSF